MRKAHCRTSIMARKMKKLKMKRHTVGCEIQGETQKGEK
jgi:hypothetical protein